MKNTIFILFAWAVVYASNAQSDSKYSLFGGAVIGFSNIDSRNPGFGMELGANFQFRERWDAGVALNSFFSESTGGFENPEDLPYLVNNAFASNPLFNLHNPNTSDDAFPGLIQFHTTFNRHSIWSVNLFGDYEVLQRPKHHILARVGIDFQYIDLIYTDYFLQGSFNGFLSGTDNAIFPVYRHQRFLDIGPTLNLQYEYQLSENWWIGGQIGGSYMPSSSTGLGRAVFLIGVRI